MRDLLTFGHSVVRRRTGDSAPAVPRRLNSSRRLKPALYVGMLYVGMRTALALSLSMLGTAALAAEDWPQWRGPMLNGTSSEKNLPIRWTTTENVTWKLAMPDGSGSTALVRGEH